MNSTAPSQAPAPSSPTPREQHSSASQHCCLELLPRPSKITSAHTTSQTMLELVQGGPKPSGLGHGEASWFPYTDSPHAVLTPNHGKARTMAETLG